MKKKLMVILLSFALLFSLTPVAAYADTENGQTEGTELYAEYPPQTFSGDVGEDNDALFEKYIEKKLGITDDLEGGIMLKSPAKPLFLLNSDILEILKEKVKLVADGQVTSTIFEITPEDLNLDGESWGAADLGVDSIIENGSISQAAVTALYETLGIDFDAILNALIASCPYELYWYDKTAGVSMEGPYISAAYESGEYRLTFEGMSFKFAVAQGYSAGEYEVNTANAERVNHAVEKAASIIGSSAESNDIEKLTAYKEAICGLVEYDDAAAADDSTPYGDPWQIISVFDEDPDTNVVCEGYSKAFQYLCDKSEFEDERVNCISVTGTMSGGTGAGPHMWNIVAMEDNLNYLVDVTNCDEGAIGAPDQLFMVGYTTKADEGVYVISCDGGDITYVYDEDTKATYNEKEIYLFDSSYRHVWGEWEVTQEPTCENLGYKKRICNHCGQEEYEEIMWLGHDYQIVEGTEIAPTCTETGKEADQKCLRCGDVIEGAFLEIIPHVLSEVYEDDDYGNHFHYWQCDNCGQRFKDEEGFYPYINIYHDMSHDLTEAVYDYLDEIYIEKYPEMGLRFKYGAPKDRQELQALADQITQGMTDDMAKAKAIVRWVRTNITYGDASPYPIDTFRNRTGVCFNYALLASQLMRLEGIPSVLVDGARGNMRTVDAANLRRTGHAWLYSHINGEWVAFDPLWTGDEPLTDREYLSTFYLINTIEGTFITYDGMDMYNVNYLSTSSRGYGPAYYKGRFKYVMNGLVEGDSYATNNNLGNANYSINGINQNVTIRIKNSDGIQDGYSYEGDANNERRNQMAAGELYTDGWLLSGSSRSAYLYENGVRASATVVKEGSQTIYFDRGGSPWILNASDDDYWLKDGNIAFRTGISGRLLTPCMDLPDGEYDLSYSVKASDGTAAGDDCITLTDDGGLELKKAGCYDLTITVREDGSLMSETRTTIYVEDAVPEPDYSTVPIDISECEIELSEYSFEYTGTEIRPEVTIWDNVYSLGGDRPDPLKEGVDYTLEYVNNVPNNWGKVIVTGIGMYGGSTNVMFDIYHDHVWDEGVISGGSNPCTDGGTIIYTCALCGSSKIEEIQPEGHKWSGSYSVDKEATCTEEGSESIHCTVCGAIDPETVRQIEKKPHEMSGWITDREATCEDAGMKHKTCASCNYTETLEIPALGHQWGEWQVVDEATTEKDGLEKRVCQNDPTHIEKRPIPRIVYDGWKQLDGYWYYFDNGTMVTNKWMEDSRGWCWLQEDGRMLTNGWAKDKVGTCWIGSNGYMPTTTQWIQYEGNWYHITKGYRDESKWMKDSKGWCWLQEDGRMLTIGWAKDSIGTCWIASNGYMPTTTQWIQYDGGWYHITKGYRDQSKWMKDSQGWCWLQADGRMLTNGWAKDSKGWCWIAANGYMPTTTQWIKYDGGWYYIEKGYRVQNAWRKDSKGWCYLGPAGRMVTNDFVKDSKGWCWIGEDGYMIEKDMWIGEKGAIGSSYIIKGYRVDNRTIEIDGVKYTFDANGKLKSVGPSV